MRKTGWIWLVAGAVGLLLGGCGSDGGGDGASSTGTGTVRILATDAPFPADLVSSAVVEVQRVEIRRAGDGEGDGAFVLLSEEKKELDLVQLRNGVTDLLAEAELAPGDYDLVRIVVAARELTLKPEEDGGEPRTFRFKVPSGPQSGLKVFIRPAITVVSRLSQDILLDFDLSRSFVVQGNPSRPSGIKGFHFKPVVRAMNQTTAGSLAFRVQSEADVPGEESVVAQLGQASYEVRVPPQTEGEPAEIVAAGSTVDEAAVVAGIPAGTYELAVSLPRHETDVSLVTIAAGNVTELAPIVLVPSEALISGSVTAVVGTEAVVVMGATVEAWSGGVPVAADATDAFGQYELSLPPGDYDLTVTGNGYEPWLSSGPVPATALGTALDVQLVPLTGTVAGVVVDGQGVPVSGAGVRLLLLGETEAAQATTAADGTFEFDAVPTGEYVVGASLDPAVGSVPLSFVGGAGAAVQVEVRIE